MGLMNQFLELMSNPMFYHENLGYWLMRIDGTCSSGEWSQKTIDDNNEWLYQTLRVCRTPFYLMRAIRPCQKDTSLGWFLDQQSNLSLFTPTIEQGDCFEEDQDLVTADGWWPVLRIINRPSS